MLRFDEEKATEAAALILSLRGGQMHYMKLIKLLYLLDREALSRWGIPVTTDTYVSMDHGPVVSAIYNLIRRVQSRHRGRSTSLPQWGIVTKRFRSSIRWRN